MTSVYLAALVFCFLWLGSRKYHNRAGGLIEIFIPALYTEHRKSVYNIPNYPKYPKFAKNYQENFIPYSRPVPSPMPDIYFEPGYPRVEKERFFQGSFVTTEAYPAGYWEKRVTLQRQLIRSPLDPDTMVEAEIETVKKFTLVSGGEHFTSYTPEDPKGELGIDD